MLYRDSPWVQSRLQSNSPYDSACPLSGDLLSRLLRILNIRGAPILRLSVLALLALCVVSTAGCVAATEHAHSVTLSWNPSTSPVTGYNVYRSTSSDGPWMRLNATIETALSYTDSGVQRGKVYFYAVSSIGSDYAEGDRSDAVSAAIPLR